MSLQSRLPKRKQASQDVEIFHRDGKNRPISLRVPGSEGKVYFVTLGRKDGFHVSCKHHGQNCPGNSRSTICYHGQAAILAAAKEAFGQVAWCESQEDAKRLTNLNGGQVIPVYSLQGKGKAFIVYAKKNQ